MSRHLCGLLGGLVAVVVANGLIAALIFLVGRYGHWGLVDALAILVIVMAGLAGVMIWHVSGKFRQARRIRMRIERVECPACGYSLRGTPGRCPECGMVQSVETLKELIGD